jgi:RNA polymerase sigma-70 factor (ECF subfamily)
LPILFDFKERAMRADPFNTNASGQAFTAGRPLSGLAEIDGLLHTTSSASLAAAESLVTPTTATAGADDNFRKALATLLPRLRRSGLSLTGSAADADELVQTTYERALRHPEQLRDQMRLDAWLQGIMRNLWIDELRRRRACHYESIEAAADVVSDHGQAIVDGRLTLETVRRTMLELPHAQRTLLVLVCINGLSYKATAKRLEIPLGTVMSRLSRARQDLHDRMTNRGLGKVVKKFSLMQKSAPPDTARPDHFSKMDSTDTI